MYFPNSSSEDLFSWLHLGCRPFLRKTEIQLPMYMNCQKQWVRDTNHWRSLTIISAKHPSSSQASTILDSFEIDLGPFKNYVTLKIKLFHLISRGVLCSAL